MFTDGSSSQAGAVAFKTPGDSATTSVAGGWARNQVKSFEAILQFSNGASGALNAVSVQLGFLGDPRASHTFASTALPPSLTAVQWKLDNKDGAIVAFDDLQVFIEPAP